MKIEIGSLDQHARWACLPGDVVSFQLGVNAAHEFSLETAPAASKVTAMGGSTLHVDEPGHYCIRLGKYAVPGGRRVHVVCFSQAVFDSMRPLDDINATARPFAPEERHRLLQAAANHVPLEQLLEINARGFFHGYPLANIGWR